MSPTEFAIFRAILRDEDDCFKKNEGKFVIFASDGDFLGAEESLDQLIREIRALGKGGHIIIVKVSDGAFVRISNTQLLAPSSRVQ